MFLVLGIDAATWKIIKPNLDRLPNFKKILEECESDTIHLKEKPYSPPLWCGMFCGKGPEVHKHREYVEEGKVKSREDIPVDFIWDVLDERGYDVRAMNVPFVVPPYNFNVDFKGIGFGLPTTEEEWDQELEQVSAKVVGLMEEKPDVLIAVFTSLDRIQHFHWGEPMVVDWYEKMDKRLGEMLFDTGFMDRDNKLIIISDHGFCSFGEASVQPLPKKTKSGIEMKGDHHEDAILITRNVDFPITKPQDVFNALEKEFK